MLESILILTEFAVFKVKFAESEPVIFPAPSVRPLTVPVTPSVPPKVPLPLKIPLPVTLN